MLKKLLLYSVSIIFIVIVGKLSIHFFIPAESYAFRQVKKIAPKVDNQLLLINKHISLIVRPTEYFNFPIKIGQHGPVKSLYSGDIQYPFYCMTVDSGLGQPLVDNQSAYGVPVYSDFLQQKKIIGYSKDCSLATKVQYYSLYHSGKIIKLTPSDLTAYVNNTDRTLLRVEQGTINRFIYTVVMPISADEIGRRLAQSKWNKRLVFQFNGGSGIGFRQGKQKAKRVIARQKQQLLDGYAVISSSGNKTSYTYNMLLAEDTARRVKKHFVSLYGKPLYTVGIGGSGGGLAQYLIAQNSTGILDGLIPLYSYPDMITQTTYALDCDLLNNYFTFRTQNNTQWLDWHKRQTVEGMNALNNFPQRAGYLQPVNQIMSGFVPSLPDGNSECINGYFGLSSFINNPKQGFLRDLFHPDVVKQVKWSFWQDLVNVLGQDKQGFGLSTWDNVGVQYGLLALQENSITIDEFVDLNSKIGSWKPQIEMEAEHIWLPLGRKIPLWLSLWGSQNITPIIEGIANRHEGSINAMQAAYRAGQVFIGKITLPVIDVRHYLEEDLDMHHVSASFFSRLRIIEQHGHSDNHVIWISNKNYNPAVLAFKMMDEWLLALRSNPSFSTVEAKPKSLFDQCFSAKGEVLFKGKGIWDGQWNNKSEGECQKVYPMFSTSRIQAGSTWSGDMFKCQLMSVNQAMKQGLYGSVNMGLYQQKLEKIFPNGVCDYNQIDQGRPSDL
ncbi:DUF6351 family protein [Candidatus Colwellia aromaticivorans]|uniref:DUF6351 family protein n=1 Tax=Candidatus Colwellia aromaticivorans TaxID=2267621 RepID=UPI000DF491E1|nr:DUF6351 family protein [Candidatus Colwellia aromaticivorans]